MQLETPLNAAEAAAQAEQKTRQLDDSSAEDRIDLIQVALLLWRNKRTILRFAVATALLTALIVFFVLKPTYTANAVFLPPQSSPGSAMTQLAGQLGSLGAIGALGGIKNPGDVYIGILGIGDDHNRLCERVIH
jgi:tyrosine-protein kinase Etk/Wzc